MIAFYITSHGLGHACRSLEVIKALQKNHPVIVVTEVSPAFVRSILGDQVEIRARAFDVGMVQRDSVEGDVAATLERAEALIERSPQLLAEEVEFLRARGIGLVAVDAPSLPLEAAWQAGLPGLAVTSFGWDFIYGPFVEGPQGQRWEKVCQWFRQGYSRATCYLRYPLSEPMGSISRRQDIPLVARSGRSRRQEIAALTGAALDKPWLLAWFHELALSQEAMARLRQLPYEILAVSMDWPIKNFHRLAFDFADLVASVEVVVTKPGFGILSDCIVNAKPVVFVPRHDFQESAVLEAAARRYLRHHVIGHQDLYEGTWMEALDMARAAPAPPETLDWTGGAEAIAATMATFLP